MNSAARALLGSALLLAPALAFAGQTASPPAAVPGHAPAEVTFQFEHLGLPVPRFTLLVREDGTGTYQAEQAERSSTPTAMRGEAAQHIDRTLQLSPPTVAKIFKTARELGYFNMACSSRLKNIADTGEKTLSYSGPNGHGSCVFHYSEEKKIQMLTDTFQAIAFTLDEGRRLEFLHRYDRLGLDAEMTTLSQEVEAGRALELGTISPALATIADDAAVIQRVRLRSAKLLEETK
jgi:hypothetical protein